MNYALLKDLACLLQQPNNNITIQLRIQIQLHLRMQIQMDLYFQAFLLIILFCLARFLKSARWY